MRMKLVIFLMTLFVSSSSQARVFKLSERTLGTYFGGTIGSSQLSRQPWGDSSGATTTTDAIRLNYSGEFGLLFAFSKMNFRFGVEYLQPQHLSDVKGKDASDNIDYILDTKTFAFIPKATVELVVYKTQSTSLLFGGSFGYAMVTMQNQYHMIDTGLAPADYTEKAKANELSAEGFAGFEFVFSDNVTLLASLGYRYLVVDSLKHQNNATTINGTVTNGSLVLDADGEARVLNMSSVYSGLTFRFYF